MRVKYILKIVSSIWLLLIVVACGGETVSSNIVENKLSVVLEKSNLDANSNTLELNILLENDYSGNINVSLDNLNISIESCSIEKVTLAPKKIKFTAENKDVSVYAKIKLNENCTPLSFNLNGDTKLSLEDGSLNSIKYESSKINIELTKVDDNSSVETNTTIDSSSISLVSEPYYFYNLPREIEINKPSYEYSFRVQVVDSKEKIVSGQVVSVLAYDVNFGELISMSSLSDDNGFATFLFTSPKSLKALVDKTLVLKLELSHAGFNKYAFVNLKFKEPSTINSKNDYRLINPTQLSVETPLIEQKIFVDLVDSQGVGIPSKEIKISTPNSKYGSFTYSSTKTDVSGRATFIYNAPIDILIIDKEKVNVNLSFKEDEVTINTVATLNFYGTSRGIPKNNYNFINATNLIIDTASTDKIISVDLVDNRGVGVENKEVKVTTPDNKFGFISSSTAITNESGKAIFSYKTPSNISSMDGKSSDLNLTFTENDITLTKTITLTVLKKSAIDYHLINAEDIIVDLPKVAQSITIDLVDNQNNPVSGKSVKISALDSKFGVIANSIAQTDVSGRATFTYTSADDLTAIDGTNTDVNLTFKEDGVTISKVVTVTILKKSAIDYHIINTSDLIVDIASETYTIDAYLVDNKGIAVSDKRVNITTPDSQFGTLDSSFEITEVSTGKVSFTYHSPTDLNIINGEQRDVNLTFMEDGVTITKTVAIKIVKKSLIDYRMINVVDLLVEFPSKEYQINAYLVDDRGVAVSGKKIEITTPNSRYGTLSSSIEETEVSTGKVSFIFTSPEDMHAIDGETTTVTLIFTEDNVEIRKTIQLSFIAGIEDSALPMVVIPNDLEEIILSNNGQTIDIPVKVFKDITPYTEGFVNVQLPKKVLDGIDVGSFNSFSVPVNEDGMALLTYTGPSNLKALVDVGDLNSTFKIYHSENTSDENRKPLVVKYDVSGDDYIPINYSLSVITQNSDFSMGIPNIEKTFSVVLKDSEGNTINDKDVNISSVEVQTQNSLIVQLFDSNTSSLVDFLSLDLKNNSPFILKSKTLSGLAPIKISMTFRDINDKVQTLSTVVNVRVLSGLPSAISISYLSTGQDSERAKYEEKFIVSVTDEYSNKVNTQPYISLGAIVGYAVDGGEGTSRESNLTKRLFYGKEDIDLGRAEGIIDDLGDNDVHATTFSDSTVARSDVFQYVNLEGANSDKLLVFGRGKSYDAMGKWDFEKIDNSTLNLQDDYFGQNKGELYYAVGHNYYQDQCLDDGREWLGTTDSETYQLDDEGSVVVSYKYDYQLMGKDASIWVNLNGYQPDIAKNIRIGEVIKHTLRGTGLIKLPANGYSLDKNTTGSATFEIWQKNSSEPYRNAHFGWNIVDGSNCAIESVKSSNSYDARTCSNGYSSEGRAYVTFDLKAPEDKACTFDINRILIAHEF
jgi:galactitol-specific phosphotransferase system IIB component